MKRKELMKRAFALSLSVMMAVSNVPAVTYASEATQVEAEAVPQMAESEEQTVENDAEEDAVIEAEDQVIEEDAANANQESQEETIIENDVQTAKEDEFAVQTSDGGAENDTVSSDKSEEEVAAEAYLKTNYIDGNNKVITSGGTGVVKREDGLTYNIGLTIPTSGSPISSLRLKYENSSSNYVTGWYIDQNNPYLAYKTPATNTSRAITRPTKDYAFTATLKLFAKGTAAADINDGTAIALATQDFTFILAGKTVYKMRVAVKDNEGKTIDGATVSLENTTKWETVKPETDGSYIMEDGAKYTLTVTKDGYVDYKESYFTFTGNKENPETTKEVVLKTLVMRNVGFTVKDKATGTVIPDAKVTVKKDYMTTVKAESDGTYKLQDGISYNYTVEATNYTTVTGSITPSKDDTLTVELEKSISEYTVKFQPMDGNTAIADATVKVEEEGYDEDWEEYWETVKANADGSYTLSKSGTYRYSVTADGYKKVENVSYQPKGTEETITVTVAMDKDVVVAPEDQETVDQIKALYDKEIGALRTSYKQYTNLNTQIEAKLKTGDYAKIANADQVKVSVVSSDDTDWLGTDGTIHYSIADTLATNGLNSKTVYDVIVKFSLNGATAEAGQRNVIIGWDQQHFKKKMQAEADQLTWDKIKSENTVQTEVTKNLTLPQCMGSSLKQVWSTVTWTSSNTDVISIQKPSIDSPIYAATGVVNQPVEDTEVTLTATFKANDGVLNSNVEKVSDFDTISVPFTVTVKGSGKPAPTEEELKAILEKYYKIKDLKDFVTGEVIDPSACTGDIQLPRYTRTKDENGEYVFANKEINVTSDNPAITISGYKANVDVFQQEDTTVNLTVSFTREGVTVSEVFPITIKKLTQEDLDKEVEMMEYAKAHYFDGIKGDNASADQITENLHAFQEFYLDADGQPVWVYDINDATDKGIFADSYFDDPLQMEGAGYNRFKSSNNAVIQHENLVVIRPESPTEVTITSWLSSERYGKYAASHKDNATLQKLYKQEVSVTVTVQPESKVKDQLETALDKAEQLLASVTEGNGAGQYPAGTKEELQNAITEAQAVLDSADATDEELENAVAKLTALLQKVQDTQNETEATVTVKINQEAGQGMTSEKMTVKAYTAEKYGYTKTASYKNKVTALDALVAWHAAQYGAEFEKNPTKYLIVSGGFISRVFGIDTYSIGICVNNKIPGSATVTEMTINTGDSVSVFMYGDQQKWQDIYLYFEGLPETIKAGESVNLTLWGMHPVDYGDDGQVKPATVQKGYTVAAVDEDGKTAVTAVTDENGQATLTMKTAGTYQITIAEAPADSTESAYIVPKDTLVATGTIEGISVPNIDETTDLSKLQIKDGDKVLKEGRDYVIDKKVDGQTVTVTLTFIGAYSGEITRTYTEKHVHSFSEWKTVSEATVFEAEKQERVCACGEKESRTVGNALKAVMKVNMTTIPLKVKQTTTKFKVTGLAKGDTVVSYTSSNKKIFTVDKNGKIKAGKKKGSAKLTVTLKSGLKQTVKVNVQKSTVKTKKIQGLSKTITLKKGAKTQLKPILNPLTSQQKLTYTSSKKKVATVSSKGVIKAKKSGKTTITVKSGSKKFKITVKVK